MVRKLSMLVSLSLIAFFKFRVLPDIRAHRGTKKMDSDERGNYDLDGVSYDPQHYNVVVSGDADSPRPLAEISQINEIVTLNVNLEPKERCLGA